MESKFMEDINKEKVNKFSKLFIENQKINEKLKNYVLHVNPLIGDKKLKSLLGEARINLNNLINCLNEKDNK